jgi:hypothetical protein
VVWGQKGKCIPSPTPESESAGRKIPFLRFEPSVRFVCGAKKSPLTRPMDAAEKARREREKAEILRRFRTFAERSEWKKARISRELGVSLSTVDRWLGGQDKILLASMLAIRRFLEKWE